MKKMKTWVVETTSVGQRVFSQVEDIRTITEGTLGTHKGEALLITIHGVEEVSEVEDTMAADPQVLALGEEVTQVGARSEGEDRLGETACLVEDRLGEAARLVEDRLGETARLVEDRQEVGRLREEPGEVLEEAETAQGETRRETWIDPS
jgi:hypothetical protein